MSVDSKRTSNFESPAAKRVKVNDKLSSQLPQDNTFDPLEDDIGVGAARRKHLKLDGYASDSSNEGRGNNGKQAGPIKSGGNDNDDDDMFGDTEEEEMQNEDQQGKKSVQFLGLNDIQGQDFSTKREFMDIVDDDLEEDSQDGIEDLVDEEVGALGKKRNAPKLDSFNMRDELEEGNFDEDGNYIRTAKDQKDNQDNWLKDVSRKDIASAREAVERRRGQEADESAMEDDSSVAQLLGDLIASLTRGETLLEALARLGVSGSGPKRRKTKQDKTKDRHNTAGSQSQVTRMTVLANRLMAKTDIDIYGMEREGLMRAYKREVGDEYVEPANKVDPSPSDSTSSWEFVWRGAEENVYGPYDLETMRSWLEDGLLESVSAGKALVRRVGGESYRPASPSLFMEGT